MEISVANRQRRTGISTRHVRLLACLVLENESACFDEISVNFLGAGAVRRLNRGFTGRDELTDVLAFEISPDRPPGRRPASGRRRAQADFPGARLGDVVVCVDRAAEQAKSYGVGLGEELARLTVHGLLHLCGMDDRTSSQRLRMRRREDFYLRCLAGLVRRLVPARPSSRRPLGRGGRLSVGARRSRSSGSTARKGRE